MGGVRFKNKNKNINKIIKNPCAEDLNECSVKKSQKITMGMFSALDVKALKYTDTFKILNVD